MTTQPETNSQKEAQKKESEGDSKKEEFEIHPEKYINAIYSRFEDEHFEAEAGDMVEVKDAEKTLDELRDAGHFDDRMGEYRLIKNRLSSIDHTTGIQTRAAQNDVMRKEIARLQEMEGGLRNEENIKKIGFISFDVRALKVINDANEDHSVGDAYLREIAQDTEKKVLPIIKKILTEVSKSTGSSREPIVELSRDGGDEFSIFVSSDVNLEELLDGERIAELFGRNADKLVDVKNPKMTHPSLIELFKEYLGSSISEETKSHLLPKDKLEKHLGDETPIPDGFEFRPHVAAGSSTLWYALHNAHKAHFKNLAHEPKSTIEAINAAMGALRYDADYEAYRDKETMDDTWRSSKNELDQFQEILQSRNEYTNRLILEKRTLREDVHKLEEQKEALKRELNICKEAVQKMASS
ncbi:MAG: hypothetical protein ABII02_03320 [Candidatus Magasanikbacteria bacterium]